MLLTLQCYILREMGKTFLLTAVGLTAVLGLGGGVMNLIELEQVSPSQLLRIMAVVIPVAGTLTLPVAALFAATMTFGRLSADNEFLACRGSGINVHRLLAAPVMISLISAACTFYFINFMVPGFVGKLSRFVQADIRQLVSQRVNSPERLALRGGRVRIYADGLAPSAEDKEAVVLTGVAILEMGDQTWSRFGTAESIAVRFGVEDGEPTIAATLGRGSYFDRTGNRWADFADQSFGPNKIPQRIRPRVKWLDLTELVRYRVAPQQWPRVEEQLAALRSAICGERFYTAVFDEFRANRGRVTLQHPRGAIVLRARSGTPGAHDGRLTFADVVVTDRRGGQVTTITGTTAALLVQPGSGYLSPQATLQITGEVQVRDATNDEALHKGRERITEVFVPPPITQAVADMSDGQLLDERASLSLRPAARELRHKAIEASASFVRQVTSELHSRLTLSLSVLVLVVLGAALGMVYRGGNALEAFGISFVPSVAVIVTNITGRQLADKADTATLGVAIMWIAIAAVALLDAWVLIRVVRR